MKKSIILLGSSRVNGNSSLIAKIIISEIESDLIELKNQQINPFSYENQNANDDFLPLIHKIITYEMIIFLTPVYWYSMSGIMTNFFDRITDCLMFEKELGRKLKGMNMVAISCGSEDYEIPGFFVPFRKSAEYLGMKYLGDLHTWVDGAIDQKVTDKTKRFLEILKL